MAENCFCDQNTVVRRCTTGISAETFVDINYLNMNVGGIIRKFVHDMELSDVVGMEQLTVIGKNID